MKKVTCKLDNYFTNYTGHTYMNDSYVKVAPFVMHMEN